MGVFSWTCPHCDHSILVHADGGINDWMLDAVVLTEEGSLLRGTYDGYGGVGNYEVSDNMGDGAVMAHLACWEMAGKPGIAYYKERGLRSQWAEDQGYFFDEEHDLIDPRITDPAERERLLTEGRLARTQGRYDQKALKVLSLSEDAQKSEPGDRWQARFSIMEPRGLMTDYMVCDSLEHRAVHALTLKDAESAARSLWGQWIESDEFKTLLARGQELTSDCQATL